MQQPKYIWVDYPQGMESVLRLVWPDALVRQDLFHVFDRYGRAIPEEHSLRRTFLAGMRDCFLVPYQSDAPLLEVYARKSCLAVGDVNVTAPAFVKFWNDSKGRWYVHADAHARQPPSRECCFRAVPCMESS